MFKERLREERDRLDLNQTAFATACGIQRNAQSKYEKGERQPDSDYLQKAAEIGVDIGYLFTGYRTPQKELELLEKLDASINKAIEQGNTEGAKNLKQASEDYQAGILKRAENAQKRKDEIQQIVHCLLELDDKDFESTANTVKAIHTVAKQAVSEKEIETTKDTQTINLEKATVDKSIISGANSNNTINVSEGGFTELPFVHVSLFCSMIAWSLLVLISYSEITQMLAQMFICGGIFIMLVLACIFMILGSKKTEPKR